MNLKPILYGSLLLAVGCTSASGGDNPAVKVPGETLAIVATTQQIADAARNIGGDDASVYGMMGPGVDPHLYKPQPNDIRALEDADLVLYNGLELEGRLGDTLSKLEERGIPVIAVAEMLETGDLREAAEFKGPYDPHVWFDAGLWAKAVDQIGEAMIQADASHATAYLERKDAFLAEINALDQEAEEAIMTIPEGRRVLITAHDAFGYFGDRYGMVIRAIQGTSTATEAGLKEMTDLADFIAENNIPAIFIESSVPPETIEALQKAVEDRGAKVEIGGELFSDAMGDEGTPEGTYLGMFRHNLQTITDALS